ncbi:ATP-binding protein [Streptomyces sp. NPDC059862]|uniref:ATP-binding protein n=1 Tax=Streptomyces sp. NPDC059862 TaxID=3346975 RepID=UPI00365A77D8
MSDILVRPELPADASPLTSLERRAIALSAAGHRNAELKAALGLNLLGYLWETIADKLGAEQRPRRQAGFVFHARVHGLLDQPDPDDPGPLPPEVFNLVAAFALGKTLKQHALDLKVPISQVEETARLARKCLDGAETQPNLVYRALPQLLPQVRLPMATYETGLAPAATPAPIVRSLSTELPADDNAHFMARIWTRTIVTALRWQGSVLQVAEVVSRLVVNAVRHGIPDDVADTTWRIVLSVAVTEADELVIDVTDLNPAFPRFPAAAKGAKGQGLMRVAQLGARLTWFLHHEGPGKTVRATLPPGPADP